MHIDDQMYKAMATVPLTWVGAVPARKLEEVSRERRHYGCSRMQSSCPASTLLEYLARLVPEAKWSSVGRLRYSLTLSSVSHRRAVLLISGIERQHKHNCEIVNRIASCVFHYVRGKEAVWWH
jgi:hypothetical protein